MEASPDARQEYMTGFHIFICTHAHIPSGHVNTRSDHPGFGRMGGDQRKPADIGRTCEIPHRQQLRIE